MTQQFFQLAERALSLLERGVKALEAQVPSPNTLGFRDPPKSPYLYVRNEKGYVWYFWDRENQKPVPVYQNGLTGRLVSLKIGVSKGGEQKLLVVMDCGDKSYILQTGLGTNFAKTILQSLVNVKNLQKPISLVLVPFTVTQGAKKGYATLFCNVYDELDQQIERENQPIDLYSAINVVNKSLGVSSDYTDELMMDDHEPESEEFLEEEPPSLLPRIEKFAKLTGTGIKSVRHKWNVDELSEAEFFDVRAHLLFWWGQRNHKGFSNEQWQQWFKDFRFDARNHCSDDQLFDSWNLYLKEAIKKVSMPSVKQ